MSNPNCDHYWLVRRGGRCPHCGVEFPGQFQPPKGEKDIFTRPESPPKMKPTSANVEKVKALMKTLGYDSNVSDAQAMEIGQVVLTMRHEMRNQPANGETYQAFQDAVRKFLDGLPWTQRRTA
jgi:hypothetical protein